MITFSRNGQKNCTTVRCEINTGLTQTEKPVLYFKWECGDDTFAALLVQHLNKLLHEQVKKISREEYEQGWKDAKAKRRKQTYFSGYFREG